MEYLLPSEAAELARRDQQTIRRWAALGLVRRRQLHRRLFEYNRADLIRVAAQMDAQRPTPTSPDMDKE